MTVDIGTFANIFLRQYIYNASILESFAAEFILFKLYIQNQIIIIVAFIFLGNIYALRVNISVAIVTMTSNRTREINGEMEVHNIIHGLDTTASPPLILIILLYLGFDFQKKFLSGIQDLVQNLGVLGLSFLLQVTLHFLVKLANAHHD